MTRRVGQPDRCTCTRTVVATIEETLACPLGWRYLPAFGWIHTLAGMP